MGSAADLCEPLQCWVRTRSQQKPIKMWVVWVSVFERVVWVSQRGTLLRSLAFTDVQKQEIREAVELPLVQFDLYRQIGIDPPRGVSVLGHIVRSHGLVLTELFCLLCTGTVVWPTRYGKNDVGQGGSERDDSIFHSCGGLRVCAKVPWRRPAHGARRFPPRSGERPCDHLYR